MDSTVEISAHIYPAFKFQARHFGISEDELWRRVWNEYAERHADELRQALEKVARTPRSRRASSVLSALCTPGGAQVLGKLYPVNS